MRRLLAVLLMSASLSGCVVYEVHDGGGSAPPPPMPPIARRAPTDACGAGALQYLVGRSLMDLPQANRLQRVIGQSVYSEVQFQPDRLTVIYDENTNKIVRVRCG